MDPSDITISSLNSEPSSLNSEPNDLTLLYARSDLPTTHETRRTQEGVLIEQSRLPNCVPLPTTKKTLGSWIWQHGHAIGVLDKHYVAHRHWLCAICYKDSVKHPLSA
jgi:hypothetical protein